MAGSYEGSEKGFRIVEKRINERKLNGREGERKEWGEC